MFRREDFGEQNGRRVLPLKFCCRMAGGVSVQLSDTVGAAERTSVVEGGICH